MSLFDKCDLCLEPFESRTKRNQHGYQEDKRPVKSQACNHLSYCMECFVALVPLGKGKWHRCPKCGDEEAFLKERFSPNVDYCTQISKRSDPASAKSPTGTIKQEDETEKETPESDSDSEIEVVGVIPPPPRRGNPRSAKASAKRPASQLDSMASTSGRRQRTNSADSPPQKVPSESSGESTNGGNEEESERQNEIATIKDDSQASQPEPAPNDVVSATPNFAASATTSFAASATPNVAASATSNFIASATPDFAVSATPNVAVPSAQAAASNCNNQNGAPDSPPSAAVEAPEAVSSGGPVAERTESAATALPRTAPGAGPEALLGESASLPNPEELFTKDNFLSNSTSVFHINPFLSKSKNGNKKSNQGFGTFIAAKAATIGFAAYTQNYLNLKSDGHTDEAIIGILKADDYYNKSAFTQVKMFENSVRVGDFILMRHEYPQCRFMPARLLGDEGYIGPVYVLGVVTARPSDGYNDVVDYFTKSHSPTFDEFTCRQWTFCRVHFLRMGKKCDLEDSTIRYLSSVCQPTIAHICQAGKIWSKSNTNAEEVLLDLWTKAEVSIESEEFKDPCKFQRLQ
ncbi:expressed unknown protein [Seminavis robusta]|uniref:RING-type domain-containing protein n=1 Tax=Seminavis robusta TaxID=568900 RepID=A0A9N8DSB7_9STRA|nr:expressed unknown protein [Seminavis robusta]|eukprot:Sro335_g120050.1 n/a (577) ;mRNA; r:30739-32575